MIHVMVADDHQLVREGVRKILATCPDIVLGCEAADGLTTLELVRKQQCACTLLLLDWTMPNGGENLIRQIKALRPQLAILVLSMHNEAAIAYGALRAGANGYITKDSDPDTLIYAVKQIGAGRQFIDPNLVSQILVSNPAPTLDKLSERELEVYLLLVKGLSVSDIARKLKLSIKTISAHKSNLMLKLDVDSIADLVRFSMR